MSCHQRWFEEFQKSREWSLKNITQEQLDEGVLGIISSIDKPLSPFGEAMSDFSMNLDKKDLEARLLTGPAVIIP